jgi:hypothetical protein
MLNIDYFKWISAVLSVTALLGCKSVMPPAYGSYLHTERGKAGSVDMTIEGNVAYLQEISPVNLDAGTAVGGALRLEPMITKKWSLPLEAETSQPLSSESSFDLVSRIGGRYIFRCEDHPDKCSAEQTAREWTYIVGFGAGPNIRFVEQDNGEFAKAYGMQVDFEGGYVIKWERISLNFLARFAYLYNEATPSTIWGVGSAGLGFHPNAAHVISLGIRVGGAVTFSKVDHYTLGGVANDLGARLAWSYRFGSGRDNKKKSKALPPPIRVAPDN